MEGVGVKVEGRGELFVPHSELLKLEVDVSKQKMVFSNLSNDKSIEI